MVELARLRKLHSVFFVVDQALGCDFQSSPIHGLTHWSHVFRNSLLLMEELALFGLVNSRVKRDRVDGPEGRTMFQAQFQSPSEGLGRTLLMAFCFAFIHDTERDTEEWDVRHGIWASLWFQRHILAHLDSWNEYGLRDELELVSVAMNVHTIIKNKREINHHCGGFRKPPFLVGLLLDSDRLDLPRVGITPDPEQLFFGTLSLQVHLHLTKS